MTQEETLVSGIKARLILLTAMIILMLPVVAVDYILSWTTRYQSWPWITVSVGLSFFELIYIIALVYTLIKQLMWPLAKSLVKDVREIRQNRKHG